MSWELNVPIRDPDEPLGADALIDLPSALDDPDDRRVCRELLHAAFMRDLPTVGALVTELERADQSARRRLLDEARVGAGLESATAIDEHRRLDANQRQAGSTQAAVTPRARRSKAAPPRAVGECPRSDGTPDAGGRPPWWCPEHRRLAGPDDHLRPDDVAAVGPNFELTPAPTVIAAMRAKDDRRRAEDERRNRDRQAEAEAIRKAASATSRRTATTRTSIPSAASRGRG
jgi:hypothetical protein